jgi:hypothetical protein
LLASGKCIVPTSKVILSDSTKLAVFGDYYRGTIGATVWAQVMPPGGVGVSGALCRGAELRT